MADPSTPPRLRLSLVIPAYNEEAGIRRAVAEADVSLARLVAEYEILVVDDGSSDGTAAAVAEEARGRPHVRYATAHGEPRLRSSACTFGFGRPASSTSVFTDADCQFDLDDLSRLLSLTDASDLAAGYRLDRIGLSQAPGCCHGASTRRCGRCWERGCATWTVP